MKIILRSTDKAKGAGCLEGKEEHYTEKNLVKEINIIKSLNNILVDNKQHLNKNHATKKHTHQIKRLMEVH